MPSDQKFSEKNDLVLEDEIHLKEIFHLFIRNKKIIGIFTAKAMNR